jgi:hypothetical protein
LCIAEDRRIFRRMVITGLPLLLLIALAIAFPGFTRLALGLCFFGALFLIASIADHARSQDLPVPFTKNDAAFAGCARANAVTYQGDLHGAKMMGEDEAGALVMSCRDWIGAYVHFCVEAGNTEARCYGNMRAMAADALKGIGD